MTTATDRPYFVIDMGITRHKCTRFFLFSMDPMSMAASISTRLSLYGTGNDVQDERGPQNES